MDRLKEYGGFAISFVGLGYIALWPMAGYAGGLLGLPLHPLTLPPTLQATGMLAAIFVAIRLALLGVRRLRSLRAATAGPIAAAIAPPPSRRKPYRQRPPVKPRSQFGLRGTPH